MFQHRTNWYFMPIDSVSFNLIKIIRKDLSMLKWLPLGLLALSVTPYYSHAAVVTKDVTIKEVSVLGNGNLVVTSNESLNANCYGNNKAVKVYFGSSGMSQEGINRMLSLFITAKTIGAVVTIHFDNSSSNCLVSRATLR
jgi:hypothetical protein